MSRDCCRGNDPDCWECNYFRKRLPGDGKTQATRDWERRKSHGGDDALDELVLLGVIAILLWLAASFVASLHG